MVVSKDTVLQVAARATCLFDEGQVEAALDRIATAITDQYSNSNPVLLCVMNGGLVMTGKLATRLHFPLQIDYLHATRYRDRTQGSDLEWKRHPEIDLSGRTVIVLDDILDEGATLAAIIEYLKNQDLEELAVAVLLDKQHQRKVPGVSAQIVGLEVADYYVYGYGMDYKGYLRNAPGIFAVDPLDID